MRKFFVISSIVFLGGLVSCSASEIDALKLEIELLRKENQALRQMLITQKNTPDAIPTRPEKMVSDDAQVAGYRMSSSGKRHNSKCRYYTSKGRECSKEEGVPCKICGG